MITWTTLLTSNVQPFSSAQSQEELQVPEENLRPFKNYRIYVTKTTWSMQGQPGGYLIMRAVRFC